MFRQAPSFPYHDLGIVEDGNTASRAISKDAYVIWKGTSYFASTDILQGATLEENVNLTEIPDGVINGVVSALNNKFPTVTLFTGSSGVGDVLLSESIENFRFVAISIGFSDGNRECKIIPVAFISYGAAMKWDITYFQQSGVYTGLQFTFTNSTKINIDHVFNASWSAPTMRMVIGIK